MDVPERRRGDRRRSIAPFSTTTLAEVMKRAAEQNAGPKHTTTAEETARLRKTTPGLPGTNLTAALGDLVRGVIREELYAAFADHRAELQARQRTRLVPLAQAAQRLGLTPKALRSRIERGSVAGAVRIGGRWHVAIGDAGPSEEVL